MKKKIYILLIFLLFASTTLFAEQSVSSSAPPFEDTFTTTTNNQSTTVVATAAAEDLNAILYYDNAALSDGTTISQNSNNETLLLTESWELTPFSIRITGSELEDFNLDIELEVGFFQLLDEYENIAQGEDAYTIDAQAMKIVNTTTLEGVLFENNPIGSNIYKYTIPLNNQTFYSLTDMANFKLTWDARDISQPGNYISNIQVTFSVD